MAQTGELVIYITPDTAGEVDALRIIELATADEVLGKWNLEIVDVTVQAERARKARVLITPTLVMSLGNWEHRRFGNLDDPQAVLQSARSDLADALAATQVFHPAGKALE